MRYSGEEVGRLNAAAVQNEYAHSKIKASRRKHSSVPPPISLPPFTHREFALDDGGAVVHVLAQEEKETYEGAQKCDDPARGTAGHVVFHHLGIRVKALHRLHHARRLKRRTFARFGGPPQVGGDRPSPRRTSRCVNATGHSG